MTRVSPRHGHRFPADCAIRFRAEKLLASGGYGAVLLATQIDLGRPVVVKLLLADALNASDQRLRFDNEARIAATLTHPHVVRVLDHGSADIPWIAYELIEGGSLRDRVDARRLSPAEVAAAGAQIASALQAAHALGILHRDVKPDNVLEVTPDHWKLTDFGIARWDQSSGVRTQHGLLMGTPAYLAPEAIRGEETDGRQDVYALGAMLFELATGRVPFTGDSLYRVLECHLSDTPPRIRDLEPDFPRELESIIHRSLEKDRDNRFATAGEMREALERVSSHVPGTSRAAARTTVATPEISPAAPIALEPGTSSPASIPSRASTSPAASPSSWRRAAVLAPPVLVVLLAIAAVASLRAPAPGPETRATAALPGSPEAPGGATSVRAEARAGQPPASPSADSAGSARLAALVAAHATNREDPPLDARVLEQILDEAAQLPRIDRCVPVSSVLASRLSAFIRDRSVAFTDAFERVIKERLEVEVHVLGKDFASRLGRRQEAFQAFTSAGDARFEQLKRSAVVRRKIWFVHFRALLALDPGLACAESAAAALTWEGLITAIVLGNQRADRLADLQRIEEGRPASWIMDYVRAQVVGAAGDEPLACRYLTRAFRSITRDVAIGAADAHAVSAIIVNLRDLAPGRSGATYREALDEARTMARKLPPGSDLATVAANFLSLRSTSPVPAK